MRRVFLTIILAMTVMLPAVAQDSLKTRASFPRAVGSLLFANVFINRMSYLTGHDYSQVTMHSIRRNLRSGFEWDNDLFFINQVGHPFQGGLNFNAARNNGFNFLQSMAFNAVESIAWEYFGEKEPPSTNDIITTIAAGTLFGECSHRLADRTLDNGDRGARRVFREAVAAFLNPLQGLERLITGKMWKVKAGGREMKSERCEVDVAFADRYVVAADGASHGNHHPFIAVATEYGETVDGERHTQPYDFIDLDCALAFGGGQPIMPRISLTARLFSTPLTLPSEAQGEGELGLYQFYKYDDMCLGDSLRGPFPYGETASFGPGIIIKSPQGQRLALEQRIFARGVILGAAESDHYQCYKRHYNMGSGYGASSMTRLSWNVGSPQSEGQKEAISLQLDAYYMQLYTWRGFDSANPPVDMQTGEADQHPNVLGDRSHTRQLALDMQLQARLTPHCGLALGAAWFSRNTHYDYHPTRHIDSYELRAGLLWEL